MNGLRTGHTPVCPAGHLPLKGGDRWGTVLPGIDRQRMRSGFKI